MPDLNNQDPRLQKILAAIASADPRLTYGDKGFSNAGDVPNDPVTQSQSLQVNPETTPASLDGATRPRTATLPPQPQTRPRYAGVPARASQSANTQSGIDTMRRIDPNADVQRTDSRIGYSAPKHMSRGRGALLGLAEGIQANQGGTLAEKIGGAAAGAIGGGFKPNLAAALKREYEIKDQQAQLGQQLGVEKEQAQVQDMQAQAAERAAQPGILAAESQRKVDAGNRQQAEQIQREAGRAARQAQRDAQREADRVERERHNRALETRPSRTVVPRGAKPPKASTNTPGNRLVDSYNKIRIKELGTVDQYAAKDLQTQRERLWNQVMSAYPGQYQASGDGQLVPKSQFEQDAPAPTMNSDLVKSPTHGMSRKTFRANNPAYRRASNAEIDKVLGENGFAPLP